MNKNKFITLGMVATMSLSTIGGTVLSATSTDTTTNQGHNQVQTKEEMDKNMLRNSMERFYKVMRQIKPSQKESKLLEAGERYDEEDSPVMAFAELNWQGDNLKELSVDEVLKILAYNPTQKDGNPEIQLSNGGGVDTIKSLCLELDKTTFKLNKLIKPTHVVKKVENKDVKDFKLALDRFAKSIKGFKGDYVDLMDFLNKNDQNNKTLNLGEAFLYLLDDSNEASDNVMTIETIYKNIDVNKVLKDLDYNFKTGSINLDNQTIVKSLSGLTKGLNNFSQSFDNLNSKEVVKVETKKEVKGEQTPFLPEAYQPEAPKEVKSVKSVKHEEPKKEVKEVAKVKTLKTENVEPLKVVKTKEDKKENVIFTIWKGLVFVMTDGVVQL